MILIYMTTQTTFVQPALINYACTLGDIHFHSPIEELSGTICRFMSYPRTFGIIADWFGRQTTRFPNNGTPFYRHLNVHFNNLTDEIHRSIAKEAVCEMKGKDLPLLLWTYPSLPLSPMTSHTVLKNLAPHPAYWAVYVFQMSGVRHMFLFNSQRKYLATWMLESPWRPYMYHEEICTELFHTCFSSALFFLFPKKSRLYLSCAEGIRLVSWLFELVVESLLS